MDGWMGGWNGWDGWMDVLVTRAVPCTHHIRTPDPPIHYTNSGRTPIPSVCLSVYLSIYACLAPPGRSGAASRWPGTSLSPSCLPLPCGCPAGPHPN
jgi:hypothetical protein